MLRLQYLLSLAVAGCLSASAVEIKFDFASMTVGSAPTGFVSTVTGQGKPGEWKIIEVEAPSAFKPLTPFAKKTSKQPVLAQIARDPTDEHFPVLVYDGEVFGNFTFNTKFRCQDGKVEQMAGVVFRYQDPENYYIVRASALGKSFRFYKFVAGIRSAPIGPSIPIPSGTWGEIDVTCEGNKIRILLNGQPVIPEMTDNSFLTGKVGFWTKSDSVSYFANAVVSYTPRTPLAQKVIDKLKGKRPSVVSISVLAPKGAAKQLGVIASTEATDLKRAANTEENAVWVNNALYYDRKKTRITAMVPIHDRNGDTIALIKVVSKRFFGETQKTTLFRASQIARDLQSRITDAHQLLE